MIVNDQLFYIHIPRTAGRFFKEMLPDNIEVPRFGGGYKGIESLHLHYPLYNECFGVKDMEHFTIVRNPFDRFKSALKGPLERTSIDFVFKNGFDGGMEMLSTVDYDVLGHKNNWFRPQHEFVSETTHVWRFEDGFGDNFIKWVLDKFNVKLKVGKPYHRTGYDYTEVPDSVNKYKSCVEEYYKKDSERFDY
tara:strand:+ start:869 stop:1444 length:576 start_codon:yes stop_codon:yes gene_type:complete